MEFKVGLPVWQECLEVAIEKFHLAGASPTDIAVMIKNHVSNHNAPEGLGFRIDEIVQAWKEMHEAKRWRNGVPTFRLEPLLRRRVSNIYHALEIYQLHPSEPLLRLDDFLLRRVMHSGQTSDRLCVIFATSD
ncbi:hypothetical protein OIU76_027038 [Salix suchowensis]|nr:hypothetical protein OIU76_027038 [Salix suchowensis]